MVPVISLRDVHKIYATSAGPVHALRGVSLTIMQGEFTAIMGASGSGKSTLLNLLGCLDQPTEGEFFLDGIATQRLSTDQMATVRSEKIGFIFQNYNLLPRTTALENIERALWCDRRHKRTTGEVTQRARHCLAKVGLGQCGHHFPSQLSGGQQQRVAIARAIANEPAVVLADEPTGNLDSLTAMEIMSLFQELHGSGITLVMVTHELSIARYATRKVILRDGSVVLDEPIPDRLEAAAELERATHELGKLLR